MSCTTWRPKPRRASMDRRSPNHQPLERRRPDRARSHPAGLPPTLIWGLIMSRHRPAPARAPFAQLLTWSLEVVRGRNPGASYALAAGETILGNALGGAGGFDLSEQEGDALRRMAGRHAALDAAGLELTISDLDSPGGTFVNRQRLLAGQARRLQPGDVIQLGSVQLVVKQGGAQPAPAVSPAAPPAPQPAPRNLQSAAAGRLPAPFAFASAQCRTWDDFLVHAAQNWRALRDELTAGRLAEYLRQIGRPDLVPRAQTDQSADDQLDLWLARVPVTTSSAPELDVHPETVLIKAATGGGITHHSLRITNVGYRLLKCTARIEPAATPWLRLPREYDGRPLPTIDQTDLPIEVELPVTLDRPLNAAIVIESNGGTRRVAVRIERPTEDVVVPAAGATGLAVAVWGEHLKQWLGVRKPLTRAASLCGGLILLRLCLLLVNVLPFGARGEYPLAPRLLPLTIVLVAVGATMGWRLALAHGDRGDLIAAGFAGGVLGLLSAAGWFAVVQTAERVLGAWAASLWAVALLWAAIGALAAVLSIFLVPYRPPALEPAR